MKKRTYFLTTFFLMISLTTSCVPFTPHVRNNPEGDLPTTFSLYGEGGEKPEKWWESFNDSDLNALIEKAFAGNPSLKETWARLAQARARAVQAGADLYPDLTLNAGGARSRQRVDGGVGTQHSVQTNADYSIGLSSRYELDLWGKIRSEREAALLEVSATREDVNTAAMSLAAEVTERWLRIISQRMQNTLLKRQLEANETYLELVELRYRKGMVSALDIYQQRQIVAKIQAQLPLVEAQEQLLLHELAVLLGKPPQSSLEIGLNALPALEKIPSMGLPADLLANRPDVRAAGLRLRSAYWDVSTARANRLPSINLTGGLSYGSGQLDLLFNNWVLSLASSLTAPIFDGKRRVAEVDRTQAVVEQNLAVYRDTVLTAIKEVEDALVSESKEQEHITALKQQMEAAQKALDEARTRYLKGIADYLPVLTQLLSVQGLEQDLIKQQTQLILYRVGLYRALGGTWTKDLQPHAGLLKG